MKHFIIISLLVLNSVFSQLVLEQVFSRQSFEYLISNFEVISKPNQIKPNFDYNRDGIDEIITGNYSMRKFYIIDIKNGTLIKDFPMVSSNSNYRDSLITFTDIFCELNCTSLLVAKYLYVNGNVDFHGFILRDLENDEWIYPFEIDGMNIGIYSAQNLLLIEDIDADGKDEIVMYYQDNNDAEQIKIGVFGDGTTTASTTTNINPSSFLLNQNFPNPFNPTTSISYQVQLSGDVTLNIYDVLGNRIKTLIDEPKAIGDYEIKWDGTNQMGERLSSGQYFYQLKVGDFVSTKKMVLLK